MSQLAKVNITIESNSMNDLYNSSCFSQDLGKMSHLFLQLILLQVQLMTFSARTETYNLL